MRALLVVAAFAAVAAPAAPPFVIRADSEIGGSDAAITGHGWHTGNGLQIGDTVARARRLFPRAQVHGSWLWLVVRQSPAGGGPYAGLAARIGGGRVAAFQVNSAGGG